MDPKGQNILFRSQLEQKDHMVQMLSERLNEKDETITNLKVDLCQYFGHKKLNFSPSITYAERIIS